MLVAVGSNQYSDIEDAEFKKVILLTHPISAQQGQLAVVAWEEVTSEGHREAFLRTTCSSVARFAQENNANMAAQMTEIRVPDV